MILFAATLQQICKEYHKRLQELENKKWDLERETRVKELEVMSEDCQEKITNEFLFVAQRSARKSKRFEGKIVSFSRRFQSN